MGTDDQFQLVLTDEEKTVLERAQHLKRLIEQFPDHPDAAMIRADIARLDRIMAAARAKL